MAIINTYVKNCCTEDGPGLVNTFFDYFSDELEKDKLYNLAWGCPVGDSAADSLISYEQMGK